MSIIPWCKLDCTNPEASAQHTFLAGCDAAQDTACEWWSNLGHLIVGGLCSCIRDEAKGRTV